MLSGSPAAGFFSLAQIYRDLWGQSINHSSNTELPVDDFKINLWLKTVSIFNSNTTVMYA